jgi:hypothetical protein
MPYGGNPGTDWHDAVRLLIGDTDNTDPQFTDAELDFFATAMGTDNYAVAAEACRALAMKYARLCDQSVGRVSVSYSQRSQRYADLAVRMDTQAAAGAVPYAAGTSVADMQTEVDDTDRPAPFFDSHQMDNSGTDPSDSDY